MKRLMIAVAVTVALVAGSVYLLRPEAQVLGGEWPEHLEPTPIGNLSADMEGQSVHIMGTIITQCPRTGCWAVIQDDTGQVRIETTGGGFALPIGREGAGICVAGTVKVQPNGDVQISAAAARLGRAHMEHMDMGGAHR